MNQQEDDDSVFEQALRADLPSMSAQNRLRQRLLSAGVAAGTVLGSTNVAAATQTSFGASALSKLSALSWPAKLGLTALVAAPVAVLPAVYPEVRGAEMVSQVQRSAAAVHARAASKTLSPAQLLPREAAAPEAAALAPTEPRPELEPESLPNLAARAVSPTPGNLALPAAPAAPTPGPAASDAASEPPSNAAPVAAFDSTVPAAAASEAAPARVASSLAAETQLLDRAFAALAAGDRSTAAALVAEHARLFPNGLLRQERERARARLASTQTGE